MLAVRGANHAGDAPGGLDRRELCQSEPGCGLAQPHRLRTMRVGVRAAIARAGTAAESRKAVRRQLPQLLPSLGERRSAGLPDRLQGGAGPDPGLPAPTARRLVVRCAGRERAEARATLDAVQSPVRRPRSPPVRRAPCASVAGDGRSVGTARCHGRPHGPRMLTISDRHRSVRRRLVEERSWPPASLRDGVGLPPWLGLVATVPVARGPERGGDPC